jgi:hypothetical protein
MPAEHYGFRPTPEAPTFAHLLGRAVDAEQAACGASRGESAPPAKGQPMPALESVVAFCRESWAKLTPGAMADLVTVGGEKRIKLGALTMATARAFEYYGRISTYLQLKGIVRDN